jgi:PhnB protein
LKEQAPDMKLTPFLLFNGNCAEAMEFYHDCLGGELILIKLADTPMAQQMPPELHNKITYARVDSNALEISGSDWLHPVQKPIVGNTVGVYLNGGSFAELKAIFDCLAKGAETTFKVDLMQMPFGVYGHLIDRFGVPWFFRSETAEQ